MGMVINSKLGGGGAEIDTTLTKPGYAADAKVTGNKLNTKLDKSQLLDAGIKDISWNVVRSEITVTTVEDPLKAQRPEGTNTRYWAEFEGCPYFKNRQLYRVTFDGTVYDNLVCKYGILKVDGTAGKHPSSTDSSTGGAWQSIGNKYLFDSRYEDTGEPFYLMYIEHGGMYTDGSYYYGYQVGHGVLFTRSASTAKIKIERATINQEDLPKSLFNNFGYGDDEYENIGGSTYPRTSLGQGNIVGRGGFAIGNNNISTGQFAFAEGHRNNATYIASHAEGDSTSATNDSAHAEGILSVASGVASHAEGIWSGKKNAPTYYSIASGDGSHAEGMSHAEGDYSHAEGYQTIASGEGAHAEGNRAGSNSAPVRTTASGDGSHAEGFGTTASGDGSHAEGILTVSSKLASHAEGRSTIAASDNQHAEGIYNIEDSASKYAHIVGNGTSSTARSNAHTLDWDGNAWYQGTVECTGVILSSPNGTKYKLTVDNDGVLTTTKL